MNQTSIIIVFISGCIKNIFNLSKVFRNCYKENLSFT